ncbi:MAG: hypothetical protein ACK2UA_07970, partial [Anaerolineae bacterium]|jgi:hypothetical protein
MGDEEEGAMDKGKVIGGLICLAIAALLGVLYVVLPEGDVMFMVGNDNVIWVPILVLAGLGVALLSTARRRQQA